MVRLCETRCLWVVLGVSSSLLLRLVRVCRSCRLKMRLVAHRKRFGLCVGPWCIQRVQLARLPTNLAHLQIAHPPVPVDELTERIGRGRTPRSVVVRHRTTRVQYRLVHKRKHTRPRRCIHTRQCLARGINVVKGIVVLDGCVGVGWIGWIG